MPEPTEVSAPIHDLIRRRWSPVAFDGESLSRAQLCSLLEAARWAPSSYNEQPWRFVVAGRDEPERFERLLSCLVPANREWAQSAGALLLSVAKLAFTRNGKPNRHAGHDVGLASENLVLQAVALGLDAHQMAGFDVARARELFAIPEDHEPMAAIAVGRHAAPDSGPLAERESGPRTRRSLSELAFGDRFGEAWGAL